MSKYRTKAKAKPGAVDPALLAKLAKIQLARKDLIHFIEYVIRDEGGNKVISPHHQIAWWKHLKYCWATGKDAIIIAPMSYSKTISIAVALPLWLLGRNPNLRIMIVSATDKGAGERLEEIGRYITDSPQYKDVFPHVIPDFERSWNKHELNVKRASLLADSYVSSVNASVSSYGYTASAGNGVRADVTLLDDVVSQDNSSSDAKRTETDSMVTAQWLTRSTGQPIIALDGEVLCPESIMAAIGTRYHPQDLYATRFIASPDAYCTMIQAVSEDKQCLDYSVYGSLADPIHPAFIELAAWEPPIAMAA